MFIDDSYTGYDSVVLFFFGSQALVLSGLLWHDGIGVNVLHTNEAGISPSSHRLRYMVSNEVLIYQSLVMSSAGLALGKQENTFSLIAHHNGLAGMRLE